MKKFVLLLLLLIISCKQDNTSINGYIEGEYIYISPSSSGILEEIFIIKGQEVEIGDKLFSIDNQILQADIDTARFSLEKAYSQYADLSKGKRPEEILVILKQKDQADAVLANSTEEFKRTKELNKTGFASKADLDIKKSNYEQARGRVNELNATLKSDMLGAREDELNMAEKEIEIAKQSLIKAQKKYDDSHPIAKVNGKIEDVYYRLGEFVNSGYPVVNILPPENVKARFFVSQKQLPNFQQGKKITINCDGCDKPIPAIISFISSQAEFTPPVIYSIESRDKLVFMIEAEPVEFSPSLHPGLPINIKLEE